MKNKVIRVYADTSVFGGAVDAEFKRASNLFFDLVLQGRFQLVISALVEDELSKAPPPVQSVFDTMIDEFEFVELSPEARSLQKAYMKAKILTPKWENDALHVALASVSACVIIVSWNFKHIVNYRKIPLYNAINLTEGYKAIAIYSPSEVIEDEN